MAPIHLALHPVPAVFPPTTAAFDASATDGSLPSWADGLLLPIAVGLVAAIAVALVVLVVLQRRQHQPAPETGDSDHDADATLASASPNRALPRWLDPSIAAARFRTDTTTGIRAAVAAATAPARMPLVFAGPVDELIERAWIRYDGVPLLDRPDDVLGRAQRDLDGGDEVEVVERGEIWAAVRTPNGVAGWLPAMTLSAAGDATAVAGDLPMTVVPDPASPPADDLPELESILAAVLAQRLERREPDPDATDQVVVELVVDPVTPKRSRSRKPNVDRPSASRSTPAGRDVVPAVELEPVAASKRRRPRTATGGDGAAKPR
jgi:hypothetical protein